jgi:hypothetical protein
MHIKCRVFGLIALIDNVVFASFGPGIRTNALLQNVKMNLHLQLKCTYSGHGPTCTTSCLVDWLIMKIFQLESYIIEMLLTSVSQRF